mmetsp:Transcript_72589/g.135589  ORF Transcript_72589/g.135589 Transcript_72589/m.135589 type:complete len:397 (+) Transcript_72589:50-1240(+)
MMKKPAAASGPLKRPAAAATKAKPVMRKPASAARSRTPRGRGPKVSDDLKELKAFVISLDRRPDRWERVKKMLSEEVPWLDFEKISASDGTENPIPESEVTKVWNTSRNAHYADYYEYVFEDGKMWKWACEANADETWDLADPEGEDEFNYVQGCVGVGAGELPEAGRLLKIKKKDSGETFDLTLQFAKPYLEPGQEQLMSGGERGCAHSHFRMWQVAAERSGPTLVLEDDVHLTFDRSDQSLGKMNGKVFTERLGSCLKHLPSDFDVLYLGWSGWRAGHNKIVAAPEEDADAKAFFRAAEYVWTTVAYVISPAGAKKLLEAGPEGKINQPVDNFMAWEASQGRLKSYVAVDEGDDDSTWAGGLVDQFDFMGDSDIKKSDGGHQGDDMTEFATTQQ